MTPTDPVGETPKAAAQARIHKRRAATMVCTQRCDGLSAFVLPLQSPRLLSQPSFRPASHELWNMPTTPLATGPLRKPRASTTKRAMSLRMTSTESSDSLATTESKVSGSKMVVITPDFRLSLSVVCFGLYLLQSQVSGFGMLFSFIGAFLVLQTIRLRFRFSDDSLDVLRVEELSDEGRQKGDSADPAGRKVAIGPWKYSSVVNWEFWWPGFPLIAYFKETQTKATGQRHFFFMIMDGKAVYGEMLKRFGNSQNVKPALEEWDDLRPLSPKGYTRTKEKVWQALVRTERRLQIRARFKAVLSMLKQVRTRDVAGSVQKILKLARAYAIRAVRAAKQMLEKGSESSARASAGKKQEQG